MSTKTKPTTKEPDLNEIIKKWRDKVQKLFDEHKMSYEFTIMPRSRQVQVVVRYGDWKHDHGHLDYIMEQAKYKKIGEACFGEDTGDDAYCSTHIYSLPTK